jgi:hypothetical protein
MNHTVNFVGAAWLACAACVPSRAPGAAIYREVPPAAPWARQGEWRPADGVLLAFGVRCSGAGADRACRIELAERVDGGERSLAVEPCGTAVPLAGVDSDPAVLVLVGEDARGGWRQLVRYEPERGALAWTRRRYDDGL